jgi:hypothetical protein
MANEITVGVNVKSTKGGITAQQNIQGKKENQTGSGGVVVEEITVTTGEYDLDLTGFGRVIMENLDTVNWVGWTFDTGSDGGILQPGGAPTTLYVKSGQHLFPKANAASCQVRITKLPI